MEFTYSRKGAALGPKPGHGISYVCGWCQELEAEGPNKAFLMRGLSASVHLSVPVFSVPVVILMPGPY